MLPIVIVPIAMRRRVQMITKSVDSIHSKQSKEIQLELDLFPLEKSTEDEISESPILLFEERKPVIDEDKEDQLELLFEEQYPLL